ncbi:thiolase domain-containing protein [Paenibacillus sp. BSR1-1]|uniref:thiolase C-terminal domain-containing protein n=1 Tax=Paenibacillus sp. BSR1-1 TaxID=3020845 RepID=UPI0025AEE056|nr:beta-ketoacyl synthase N-terminal-like domain-containing protein [Paenibacillus sp. BSR1-1]MDN3016149.1 thiolase domain-containing protein [Paenibacillus sp. BSR1-1]
MNKVAVSGLGITPFGKHENTSLKTLLLDACLDALREANFPKIDAVYIGNFMSGSLSNQEILGAITVNDLGLGPIPAVKVEGACASGGIAFRQAFLMIQSGEYENVLIAGVEKMKHATTEESTRAINAAMDNDSNEKHAGLTFPGFFGMLANRYFYETGASKKHLAMVALKNREYAMNNPIAQFKKTTSLEEIMNARIITDPLGLFDCSPTTDGAVAIVLSKGEKGVIVRASAQASGSTQLQEAEDILSFPAIKESANRAYHIAGLGPEDIDVVELHDCFSMTEIIAIEELGLFKKGSGWQAVEQGLTKHGGKVPVNTSGGLLSKGHPIGATGLAQIYQIVSQLRGTSCNQVEGANIGLAQNLGGTGAYSTVHIFEGVN